MKFKSIIDVITNSSDETFIIKTNESIDKVNTWLSENVEGWCDLQKIDSNRNPLLFELTDSFDYLYNSKDINSIKEYHIEHVFCNVNENVTKEELEIRANLCEKWLTFLTENRRLINKISRKHKMNPWCWASRLPKADEIYLEEITLSNGNVIYDVHPYWITYINELIPTWLYKQFITQFSSENKLPSNWELPKDMDMNTYIGGYGFTSSDENLIPYGVMKKIANKYPESKHFHLA